VTVVCALDIARIWCYNLHSKMPSKVLPKSKSKVRVYLTFSDGLWQILARTDHIIAKLRQKELRQYGMTMNEAIVLFTVLRLKLSTPANISQQLFWEPHTVSEQLKSMETKGLIKKVRDLQRHNLIRVEVTEKGLEAYRESARRKSTREIMSALSKDEQVQLWNLLAKLRGKAMSDLGLVGPEPFPSSDPSKFRD
jgi:DNA-binding MarR family transcriptional regulator